MLMALRYSIRDPSTNPPKSMFQLSDVHHIRLVSQDPGEFVEASAVSVAYLWMILVWTLASRKNPKIRPYLKIKALKLDIL